MLSYRALERITGILLIALIPAFILSTFAVSEVDTYEKTFRVALKEIADDRATLMMGTGFLLVASLMCVALAALLYLVFRPHEPALALLGTFGFLATGFAFMVGGFVGAGLIDLAGDFAKAAPTGASAIVTSARPLAVILESAFYIGANLGLALSALVFGTLVVWSKALPWWLGALAIAGACLTPSIYVFWYTGIIGVMVILLWLLLTGGWMVMRGTREVAEEQQASVVQPRVVPA